MMKQMTLTAIQETLQSAPVGILLLDDQESIQWHNDTLLQLLNIGSSRLTGTLDEELRAILIDPAATIQRQQAGEQRWLRCNRQVMEGNHKIHFYLDITTEERLRHERDQLNEDLQQLTTRDFATGLPNRHALLQGLEPLISRSRRYGNPLSLIMMHTHPEGAEAVGGVLQEQLWMQVAQLLKDQMRWADIIGRYDGSDFLLILPETTEEAAGQLAEKLSALVKELRVESPDGESYNIKPYCGITGWHKGDDASLMLQRISDSVSTAKAADKSIAA